MPIPDNAPKSVNLYTRGYIVWGGDASHNKSESITKIVYCDNNGRTHVIWPCDAMLDKVYIVELSENGQVADISTHYTVNVDTQEPTIQIKPETDYAIKGDILFKNGDELSEKWTDCYFWPQTAYTNAYFANRENGIGNPVYSIRYAYNNGGEPITPSHQFYIYRADSTLGHIPALEVQNAIFINGTYIQNGYIYDTNYETPVLLQRADVYRGLHFYENGATIPTNAGNASGNIKHYKLAVGDTLVFDIKGYRYTTDPEWFSDYESVSPIDSHSDNVAVAHLSNGQYSIYVKSAGTNEVSFTVDGTTEKLIIHQSDILLSTNSINATFAGKRYEIDVTAFVEWTATITYNDPNQTDWITLPITSGTGSYANFEIGIDPNNNTNSRNATITFTAQTTDITPETVSLNISQEGNSSYVTPSVTATAKNWYNDTTGQWKNAQSWQVAFNGGTTGNTWNDISIKIVNATLDPNSDNYVVDELISNETITVGANQIQYKGVKGANKINQHDEYNLSYNGATVDTNHYTLIVTSDLTTIAQDLFEKTKY